MPEKSESERLARLEERADQMDTHVERLNSMRDDFIALKARWGMVAAIVGAFFAAVVSFAIDVIKGFSS